MMTLEMPSFPLYYSILYNSTIRKIVHLFINISVDLYFTKSQMPLFISKLPFNPDFNKEGSFNAFPQQVILLRISKALLLFG